MAYCYFDIFVTEVQIKMTNDFVILTKYWLIIFGLCFLYFLVSISLSRLPK
jgi:hypothetical protein